MLDCPSLQTQKTANKTMSGWAVQVTPCRKLLHSNGVLWVLPSEEESHPNGAQQGGKPCARAVHGLHQSIFTNLVPQQRNFYPMLCVACAVLWRCHYDMVVPVCYLPLRA